MMWLFGNWKGPFGLSYNSLAWYFGNRKGPSGFSYNSTAEEVTQGINGSGLTAIVTACSGIGRETARVLALRGVHVIMAVIDANIGKKVKENIVDQVPSAKINVMEIDLSSLASVRRFALEYKSRGFPLNILINNAGVMVSQFKLSKDDIELHFAVNYLGHFLLTNLLLENMITTASQSGVQGRIIGVSSVAHRYVYPEGIQFDQINHNTELKYGKSKLAIILHANELARRLKEEGINITANCVHPGAVATNIYQQHSLYNGIFTLARNCKLLGILNYLVKIKNVEKGAATTCYVALHPQVNGVSGEYFAESNISNASSLGRDTELAKKLRDFSLSLIESVQVQ